MVLFHRGNEETKLIPANGADAFAVALRWCPECCCVEASKCGGMLVE